MTVRAPRSTEAATRLLEQYAELDGQIAKIEEDRQVSISAVNSACDKIANGLIERRAELLAVLEPWWSTNAAELTGGKRKSIELGGCMIGSKVGRASLAIDGDEKVVIVKLGKRTWAEDLLRVTTSIDKPATLKALAGEHGRKLKALGLSRKEGNETFFVDRAEQAGTRAATA